MGFSRPAFSAWLEGKHGISSNPMLANEHASCTVVSTAAAFAVLYTGICNFLIALPISIPENQ